jgi:hypothetical protein
MRNRHHILFDELLCEFMWIIDSGSTTCCVNVLKHNFDILSFAMCEYLVRVISIALGVIFMRTYQFKRRNPEKNLMNYDIATYVFIYFFVSQLKVAFADTVLGIMRVFKFGPYKEVKVTFENGTKDAMTATKLSDWGDRTFVKSYKIVTDTPFYKRLTMTNMGYIVAQKELQILLRKKLKLIDCLKKNPDVVKTPMTKLIFVFGLGRSGTTFFHRLLDCNPEYRLC